MRIKIRMIECMIFFLLLEIDVKKDLNIMFFFVWILNVNEFVIFVICIDLYFDKF